MREILFRGKRIDNGEWVYGAYSHHNSLNRGFIVNVGVDKISPIAWTCEVIPETVGQYTGLTDKNGKKIFEGDILESKFTKMPYLVCFGEYTYSDEYWDGQSVCGWYNEDECGRVTVFGCPDDWATVIGNIHDNPELLKGEGM